MPPKDLNELSEEYKKGMKESVIVENISDEDKITRTDMGSIA